MLSILAENKSACESRACQFLRNQCPTVTGQDFLLFFHMSMIVHINITVEDTLTLSKGPCFLLSLRNLLILEHENLGNEVIMVEPTVEMHIQKSVESV